MAYMNSGSGSLKLAVSKGSSLIIRNLRNTETTAETRARVLREMAVHIPASERSTVRT